MMRTTLAAVLGGATLAGCGERAPRAELAFSPARLVSQETENGATPMFLATSRGDRVVAWVSAPDGGSDGTLNVSVTPAGAAEPLPTVAVRDPLGPIEAHGEAPPQLTADRDGGINVLYVIGKEIPGQRFPASALRFIRSTDLGRTWTAPVTVTDGGKFGEFGAHNFHALTTGQDGMLLATWLDASRGKSGVWMSRSRDGGRSWEPNRPIYTDPTCPCCRTAVAVAGDGTIYVAWRAVLDGDVRDIVVMRSTDGGGTWEPPVRPREDGWVYPGCPHAGPSMKVDSAGAVHIAWWTGKPGDAGVYYARSTDGGRRFEPQPIAVGTTSTPAHVQVALAPAGGVLVTWDDGQSETPRVLVRRSADGGRTFGAAQVVSDEGPAATFPVLALYGDSLAVAWSQMTAAEHRAKLAAREDMKDPKAVMRLPRVGQSEIFVRAAKR